MLDGLSYLMDKQIFVSLSHILRIQHGLCDSKKKFAFKAIYDRMHKMNVTAIINPFLAVTGDVLFQGLSPENKRTEFVLTKSLDESNCRYDYTGKQYDDEVIKNKLLFDIALCKLAA